MAKSIRAAEKAIRAGVHDVACEHGTARVHVDRDRTPQEIARIFGALAPALDGEAVAHAA